MLRRSLLPRVGFAALAGLAAAVAARPANAQSIALSGGVSYPYHLNADGSSRALRDVSLNPQWVSYQDCEDGEILQFPLQLSNWTGVDLFEIWAGTTDCTSATNRGNGAVPQCWQVYSNSGPNIVAVTETLQINIAVRDILAFVGNPPQDAQYHPNQGNERACHTQVNDAAVTPSIYFMAINPSNGYATDGSPYQYTLTTDLVGPPPPGNPTLALGDTLLVVNWGPIQDPSTIGYDVFMDPLPGQGTVATEAGIPEASTTTETYCPDSSAAPVDAAPPVDSGDDGSSDAEAGAVSTNPVDSGCFTYTINTGNSSTPASSCSDGVLSSPPGLPAAATSPVLADGGTETFFDAGYEAGTTTGSTSGGGNSTIPTNYIVASVNGQTETNATVTGLVDGVTYNVVVAAYDGTGNIGPQTAIACAAPAPINDFWKTYKEAGGGAGGGFCSLDAPGAPVGTGIFALAFGASTLGAVRRWRRKT